MNHYKYLIFDAQYLLTRNFKLKCNFTKEGDEYLLGDGTPSGKHYIVPDFDYLELAKLFFWSIAKFTREVASCKKVILLWDKYPYHKLNYIKAYKDDRKYYTDDDLIGLDHDKDIDNIIRIQFESDCNKIKQKTKYWIIDNFDKLGMKSYIKTGYEADDWGSIVSQYLSDHEPNEKSAVVSSDSDWDYFVKPTIDRITTGRKNVQSTIITYDSMINKWGPALDKYGLDLYRLKSIIDSSYGSHNALRCTLKNSSEILDKVLSEYQNYNSELFGDYGLFKAQLDSFNYTDYPEYDKVLKSLWYLDKGPEIMSEIEYTDFCLSTGFGVTLSYYTRFVNTLSKELYHD